MASNADKKNEARVKREQAQAAAAAAAKRNKMLQYLAAAVFAAIVVVVLVVVITGKKDDSVDTKSSEVAGIAATNKMLDGIEQNGLTLGDPKAPVTILEFIDVQCPFCKEHQLDQQPKIVNDLVRTGKAKIRLMPIALTFMGEDSEAGRTVAIRLAAKDKAWPFLNLFFWNQGQEQTGYVTPEYLAKLAVAAGGTKADTEPREPSPEEAAKLKEIDDLQEPLDVTGTPTFVIGTTGADPATYTKFEATGSGSVAEQLIKAVNDMNAKSGATTPGT